MQDLKDFNRTVTGAVLFERWRQNHFPQMEWHELVAILIKEWGGNFDDLCWSFASGQVLIAVGDCCDIHLFFPTP